MYKIAIFAFFSVFIFNSCNSEQEIPVDLIDTEEISITIDTLATGLENPWGMAFLPDGRILIAERPGRLRVFAMGELRDAPVQGIPEIWDHGQGGLLDVVLHPDYDENGWIYLAYASPYGEEEGTGNTSISRGKLTGNSFTEMELIFQGEPATSAGHHFGSRIVFDDDGYLFTTIGDRGVMNNAQTLENHNGKVLRIHDDGSVPADNPFLDVDGAKPEIWSYGHRNIQGMGLHPDTRQLWSHEHGPMGGDEINLVRRALNYGWPEASYGVNYNGSIITEETSLPGMEDPILQWTPSIAPCGLAFVDSDRYPAWRGNMLVGALAGQHIHRVVFDGNEVTDTEYLLDGFARFRDVRQGPDGYIYVLTEAPGLFFRIIPWETE